MKRWYWYVGRSNELLLDYDSERRAAFGILKLRRNMRERKIRVRSVRTYRSHTPDHWHVIVTLAHGMEPLMRAEWERQLLSDNRRAGYFVMRTLAGITTGDVLIADREYPEFRKPDHECGCKEKHKRDAITGTCPVTRELWGDHATAEYFARAKRRVKGFRDGIVPLNGK
jgi:hypothetical protein